MKPNLYRFLNSQSVLYARSISNEPWKAARRMRAGKICRSCKSTLPPPHTQGAKLCDFCVDKHLVYMYFRYCFKWHCGFRTEGRKKLPREFAFDHATALREIARRGNGLIDDWDRTGFELALEIGRGGVWLRLSDDQYRALGGALN